MGALELIEALDKVQDELIEIREELINEIEGIGV